eukprot:TRINITY_DN63888_c0_g1_i1.p1 TRINITY_DN63888_c0_g1~~TRINITY_DN63888_c0_g1_i1.p1  ORF type:complete len:229 (+),score=40.44 TRINITY_DN63888_c0_g1_i1:73-687(+)
MDNMHYFENGKPSTAAIFNAGVADAPAISWSASLGPSLLTQEGEKPTDALLAGKRKVALLFSGQWCPYCRSFEPFLRDLYNKLKESDANDTEVVYVSVDADEAAFQTAIGGMSWPAVPYNKAQGNGEPPIGFIRKKVREATGKPMGVFQEKHSLSSVPSILVFDGTTGNLIADSSLRAELGPNPEDGCRWTEKAPASWLDAAGN